MTKITVVIKAYNEAKRIEQCLNSIFKLNTEIDIEVILADSLSSDETISLASKYPLTVVQLHNPWERCCGIGPQLGYQFATGDYIYILDGDMELIPGFLEKALEAMQNNPRLGGVGGLVQEVHISNMQFMGRTRGLPAHMKPGQVDRLAQGGLYRRSALEDVGYFSNRNLHAFEELDLALRLRSKGWTLSRLDMPAAIHHGHTLPTWQLLGARWRSGYARGPGELLRASLGQPYFAEVLKEFRAFVATLIMWLLLLILLIASPVVGITPFLASLLLLLFLPFFMSIKKRHLALGFYSVVAWQVFTAGMLRGFLKRQQDPKADIVCDLIKDMRASATQTELQGHTR